MLNEKEIKGIWRSLRKYPNVNSFDSTLRPRIKNGKVIHEEQCLRVYVTIKKPISALKKKEILPFSLEGIPIDIIEIGVIKANRPLPKGVEDKVRPIQAGTSACHKDCTACTLTAFFKNDDSYILVGSNSILASLNNHCGALENIAKIGDEWIQPSPYDGGLYPADIIAKLHHFVEIKFSEFECTYRNALHKIYRFFKRDIPLNKVDISFGLSLVPYSLEVAQIPNAFKGYRDPILNEDVQKHGRTTEYTIGKVISLNWTGVVQYSRGIATFTDCILIEGYKFSQGGDSGSPVFDMEGNLVGILFAGSDQTTILMKVNNVLKEGKVELIIRES